MSSLIIREILQAYGRFIRGEVKLEVGLSRKEILDLNIPPGWVGGLKLVKVCLYE